MAIQDNFNLGNALNSQSYAYKCWYNYNYGNNTMGISAKDMGEITQAWNSELSNWHATATDDENAYEIEDDDYSNAYSNGKSTAQDKTGYEGGKGGMGTRSIVDSASAVVGTAASLGVNVLGSSASQAVVEGLGNATEKVATSLGAKATTEATKQTASEAGKSAGSWIVAAPLSLATGTAYMAKKPNKEQKEACDELQNEMTNAQASLYTAQEDMATMSDEIVDLSDETNVYNEDANEQIKENKAEYDMYKASYETLMAKVESGQTLTEDEKALLKDIVPLMQELGITIQETSTATTESVSEIYDEMGTYQEGYDNAAETMGEVEGLTDYAESFDEATRTNCYVEAAAQGLNAASGTTAAVKAGSFASSGGIFTAWAWGFAAMGAAGAAMSGTGTVQQMQWAGDVGTEIDMREATQDLNAGTSDVYDESIAGYEGSMEVTEEMTLAIPEDTDEMVEEMEIPEESPQIPTGEGESTTAASSGFGLAAATTGEDKDDKNKEKPVA